MIYNQRMRMLWKCYKNKCSSVIISCIFLFVLLFSHTMYGFLILLIRSVLKNIKIKFVIFTFSFLIMHTSRALKLILSQSAHTVHTNVIGVLVNPIRRDNYIIFQYSNKQEGYGPCCSPKKHFQVINKPEQKQVT